MAHYAFLNKKNQVVEVIVGKDETEVLEGLTPEEWYSNFRGLKCVRTSYNGNIRKHFAAIGMIYNATLDAFIPPKPYPSWVLNEVTCLWNPPTPRPENDKFYQWDEAAQVWIEVAI